MVGSRMMGKIFVFGSNLAGRHGKGAAKYAHEYKGAIYGQGQGPQGQSYAIPTKGKQLERLTIPEIARYVEVFKRYCAVHPDLTFELTPIGTGLAGYRAQDIGPLFKGSPPNVEVPDVFKPYV